MYEQIQKVFNILINSGYECFIAGGAVRDIVRSVEPSDYDFASSALPQEIIKVFESAGYKTVPTGIEHGTITVIIDNISFEVTTYRIDTNCDGRHCDVQFTTSLEEDIKRRDFTVNALAMDINNNIIDLVDGIGDIHRKLIKAVGDPNQRFQEDYLRILRAIRFYTKLDFEIDPPTYQSIKKLYPNLTKISRERIRDEFNEILLSPNRIKGILMLYDIGIIDIIIPDFSKLADVQQPAEFHPEGDVFKHTTMVLSKIEEGDSLHLILATLLHDFGKLYTYTFDIEKQRITFNEHDIVGAQQAKEVLRDLKYDNDTIEKVYYIISNHMKLHQKLAKSTIKRLMLTKTDTGYIYNPVFDELLKLHKYEMDASIKSFTEKEKQTEEDLLRNVTEIKGELDEELKKQALKRLITGYDVMNMGIEPGPIISEIMTKIEDAQLDGIIKTRDQALEYLKTLII
jgi:putative nucleotidyltransferase with HDIG domain